MPRLPIWLSVLWILSAAAAPASAEVITVGPGGCDQPSLALAFLRAAITPESDTIYFSTDQTWTGAGALVLANESSVTLRGVSSCSNFSPIRRTITTTIGDLFEFDNTSVTIRDLRLLGDTAGRLVTATGTSVITVQDALLVGGMANEGGNVHLSSGASLVALEGAQINGGEATFDGGGIFCTGSGTVGLGVESKVSGNDAGFNGGGVYVEGCSLNLLAGGPAPPGINHYGLVDNRAEFNGGGAYARGGSSVFVNGSGTRPATIRENDAVGFGGGLYLTGAGTTANIWNAEIVSNRGLSDAGGVMVTSQASLLVDRTVATCDRGVSCSLLDGNSTGGVGAPSPVEGGALLVTAGGTATVRQTYITGNAAEDAGNVAAVVGAGSFLLVENSVLYDNHTTGVHVVARDGGHARLAFVSAWGSSAPGFGTAFAQAGPSGRVDLYSSVVIEGNGSPSGGGPGTDPVFLPAGAGGFYGVDCVIAHEDSSSPFFQVVTDPAMVWNSPTLGDPHLKALSPAIDVCDAAIYAPVDADIDNEPRGTDVPTIPDDLGPYDLGADEWSGPPPDPNEIFSDGFESGNASRWSQATP